MKEWQTVLAVAMFLLLALWYYAKEHHLSTIGFSLPIGVSKSHVDALFSDPVFVEYNDQQHNRFRAAMKKLLLFLRADPSVITSAGNNATGLSVPQPVADEKYIDVLTQNFRKGFRLGSPIELRKFKRCYEQMNGKALDDDDATVESKITVCGIQFEDKVFVPQTMLGDETHERLFAYIQEEL